MSPVRIFRPPNMFVHLHIIHINSNSWNTKEEFVKNVHDILFQFIVITQKNTSNIVKVASLNCVLYSKS